MSNISIRQNMTQQIIIHDVNVAECEYHSLNKFGHILCDLENNPIVRSQGRLCEQNPICPYKVRYDLIQKLKRKEQECEKLRFPMKDTNYALLTKEEFEEYDLLKTENEKYKQALQEIKKELKQFIRESNPNEVDTETLKEILQKCEVLKDVK